MWTPDGRPLEAGAAFPMTLPKVHKEVVSFGDYDKGDGTQVIIYDGNVLFMSQGSGMEITIGVTIERMLEVIGLYNRETAS